MIISIKLIILSSLLFLFVYTLIIHLLMKQRLKKNPFCFNRTDLARALENLPVGFIFIEKDHTYSFANIFSQKLLKLSAARGKLPGTGWSSLLKKDFAVISRNGSNNFKYREVCIRNNTEICWWIIRSGDAGIMIVQDMTECKEQQKIYNILISELSHELRTPVAALLTHLEILSIPGLEKKTADQSLELLKSETGRMSGLIYDMLDLSRISCSESIRLQPVDILDIANQAISNKYTDAKQKGISISLESGPEIPLVDANAEYILRVLLNLLDNAIKYIHPCSEVKVIIQKQQESIKVIVQDTGPGIEKKHLPYITRRFYRAGSRIRGNGLGLSMISEILKSHGSNLEIQSKTGGPGSGCSFSFELPFTTRIED